MDFLVITAQNAPALIKRINNILSLSRCYGHDVVLGGFFREEKKFRNINNGTLLLKKRKRLFVNKIRDDSPFSLIYKDKKLENKILDPLVYFKYGDYICFNKQGFFFIINDRKPRTIELQNIEVLKPVYYVVPTSTMKQTTSP